MARELDEVACPAAEPLTGRVAALRDEPALASGSEPARSRGRRTSPTAVEAEVAALKRSGAV